MKRYDSLYQNVDYYKYHALANTSIFAARRLLFTFIIVFCQYSIVLQILLADLLCTLLLIYYTTVVPMTNTFNNCIQVFNEAAVLILIWLLLHQTEYIGDVQTRIDWGWRWLYFVSGIIALNIIFVIYVVSKKVYKAIKKRLLKK